MILAVLHKLTHYKQVYNIANRGGSQNIFINTYLDDIHDRYYDDIELDC